MCNLMISSFSETNNFLHLTVCVSTMLLRTRCRLIQLSKMKMDSPHIYSIMETKYSPSPIRQVPPVITSCTIGNYVNGTKIQWRKDWGDISNWKDMYKDKYTIEQVVAKL